MLRVTRLGETHDGEMLQAAEDQALRDAFGRRARVAGQAAGSAVVQRHQRLVEGCWFLCDCRGDVERPPVLIPTAEGGLRRLDDVSWPRHHAECDFYRGAAEQRAITASFGEPLLDRPLDLLDTRQDPPAPVAGEPRRTGYGSPRSPLATLLMSLLARADLNRLEPGGRPGLLKEQYARLHRAAAPVELERGLLISHFLCTYPPALKDLIDKIERADPTRFPTSGRPHGLLIGVFDGAAGGVIHPARGNVIPVRGEIVIFRKDAGQDEGLPEDHREDAPYIGIGLVGRTAGEGAVEVLEAYLHPIASPGHLMPVDGSRERATLDVLVKLERWLRHNTPVRFHVEKPLFDISGDPASGTVTAQADRSVGVTAETSVAREPCIPDFILRKAKARPGTGVVVVETAGYSDALYRAHKLRGQAAIDAALGGVPVVEHNLLPQSDTTQEDSARTFWRSCRGALEG